MTKRWESTVDDDDARNRAIEFWEGVGRDLDAGQFWADRIKEYHGDPLRHLALALDNLPLPAAFKEAAMATRSNIRAKRKAGAPIGEELAVLYRIAALRSLMLDYAPRLREPGSNVLEAIPGVRLRSLCYEYLQVGYRHLALLNKTDIKWLVQEWGEPASHSTLNNLHRALWEEYESKLIEARKHADERLRADVRYSSRPDARKSVT